MSQEPAILVYLPENEERFRNLLQIS